MNAIKQFLPVLALFLAFGFGYYVCDLQQNKTLLKQERQQRKVIDKKIEVGERHAKELENELTQVKQHEQRIITNAIENSQKADRASSYCTGFDDDFIKLFNEQNRIYERILSGEHDATLPGSITRP